MTTQTRGREQKTETDAQKYVQGTLAMVQRRKENLLINGVGTFGHSYAKMIRN